MCRRPKERMNRIERERDQHRDQRVLKMLALFDQSLNHLVNDEKEEGGRKRRNGERSTLKKYLLID